MKEVKLTKIKESDNPTHPDNIQEGFVKVGEFMGNPEVGNQFWISSYWRTSTVKEILTDNTFRTHNSIYKWELIN